MTIYIYSDESGVFDKKHNDLFVFGGIMFFTKDSKDSAARKYLNAENVIRKIEGLSQNDEVKACRISNNSKNKLYRSLNQIDKFGIVIHQKNLFDPLFLNKKSKQRYLDWAFKMSIKDYLEKLIERNEICAEEVYNLLIYVDEHTTATDGVYELKESIEQEFKIGTYSQNYMYFHRPLFPNLNQVRVEYCNSSTTVLVRAADIVANKLYYMARSDLLQELNQQNFNIIHHPHAPT